MMIYMILAGAFLICFIAAGLIFWRIQANQTGPTVDDLYGPQTTMPGQTTIPTSSTLPPPSGGPFQLTVEDIFNIRGRGTVVTGRVAMGQVQVGEVVLINNSRRVKVTGVEMFAKKVDTAQEGDNVGLLLEGINKEDVQRGDILSK